MTAKNTDKVPVTEAMSEAAVTQSQDYINDHACINVGFLGVPIEAAINASPELTALIAENERMREALSHLSEDNYYTEECRRIAKQALGEKS